MEGFGVGDWGFGIQGFGNRILGFWVLGFWVWDVRIRMKMENHMAKRGFRGVTENNMKTGGVGGHGGFWG